MHELWSHVVYQLQSIDHAPRPEPNVMPSLRQREFDGQVQQAPPVDDDLIIMWRAGTGSARRLY